MKKSIKAILHIRENTRKVGMDESPYKATFEYPEGYKNKDVLFNESQKTLHPSKRKYLHPHERYEIGYTAYMSYVKIGEALHPKELDNLS